MKLEIDTQYTDEITHDIIRALGKRYSLVEWSQISSVKVDELGFMIINALYEKREGVLKVVYRRKNKDSLPYDDVRVEVFSCTTLQQAMETAKDTIELMMASITKEHA